MNDTFALIHTWPAMRNAEYEVLQRILAAADNVGKRAVVIDNDGIVLWCDPAVGLPSGETLPRGVVDFVVSLHFESPRVVDEYSYYALWQPIEFYHDFGYQKSIDKFTTHNDLLSCASDLADAHAVNLYTALGRKPLLPLPTLFHSLPEPFLAPDIGEESRLFYIGINWERIGRPKGRFHDMLVMLDKRELTDIYGPEEMLGVAPWEGFATYRGELPFDGRSVKAAINRAGICLALSSVPHKNTGIMSNRLFEGLAGGAAIIATPNPLIDKYFRDAVYLVDDTRGDTVLGQQIVEAMRAIRADPEEATRRVLLGQEIVREHCSLERSIDALFAGHAPRVAHFEQAFLAETELTAILVHDGGTAGALLKRIGQVARQKRATVDLHILCEAHLLRDPRLDAAALATGAIRTLVFHALAFGGAPATFDGIGAMRERTGPRIAAILREADAPFFAFLGAEDVLFADHFASLGRALAAEPDALMACSGMIRATRDLHGRSTRLLESLRFADFDAITLVHGTDHRGRFLFHRTLLEGDFAALMVLLDGEEPRYFRLAALLGGPLAQSGYASYLADEGAAADAGKPAEPAELQQQYIRDRFARDPRWMERLSKGVKLPEFVYAYSPGSPIRWADQRAPRAVGQRIPLDRTLETIIDGPGLPFLVEGFSHPEPHHIWLAAERGVIEFGLEPEDARAIGDYELVFVAEGRRSRDTGRQQHVTVAVNGMVVAYVLVPDAAAELRIRIPINLIRDAPTFRVELTPDHAEPVLDRHGAVIDHRRLSLRILSLALLKVVQAATFELAAGEMHDCGSYGVGADILVEHFYAPEETLAWMAGTRGGIRFRLDDVPEEPVLRLRLTARGSLGSGKRQEVRLKINGTSLGRFRLADGPQELAIDLDRDIIATGSIHLTILADHAEAVYDQHHAIVDSRLLGIAIVALGILDRNAHALEQPDADPAPAPEHLPPVEGGPTRKPGRWLGRARA